MRCLEFLIRADQDFAPYNQNGSSERVFAMLLGYSRFTISRVALVAIAVGILSGCSERKPAGPLEGATATESQPMTPTATPADAETETK
jgi:hypothetical protein